MTTFSRGYRLKQKEYWSKASTVLQKLRALWRVGLKLTEDESNYNPWILEIRRISSRSRISRHLICNMLQGSMMLQNFWWRTWRLGSLVYGRLLVLYMKEDVKISECLYVELNNEIFFICIKADLYIVITSLITSL